VPPKSRGGRNGGRETGSPQFGAVEKAPFLKNGLAKPLQQKFQKGWSTKKQGFVNSLGLTGRKHIGVRTLRPVPTLP